MTPRIQYKNFTAIFGDTNYCVYDASGEPCGSIELVDGSWTGHVGLFGQIKLTSVGPSQALRRIAIYHGA